MGINTDSVNKQIYELIKVDILERRLRPGEKIDTKGIAEANGISVMPVRNALQQLTTNGLVVNRERVGFYVREFSLAELAQIFEVRRMFELHCLGQHLMEMDKGRVQEMLAKLSSQITGAELDRLDHEMHRMIVCASRNPFLIHEYDNLSDLFSLGMFGGSEEEINAAKQEHIAILSAILSDDEQEAEKRLREHLNRAKEEIIALYRG